MARRIEAAGKSSKEPTDRRMAQIERDLFIGCYSVRKLLHTPGKLTDACRGSKVQLRCHSATGKPVTLLNHDQISELYDLESEGLNECRDLEFFCGRIIHSFIFLVGVNDDLSLAGFFFGSDRDRGKRLFRVATAEVVRVFTLVGKDRPASVAFKFDPTRDDYTVESI
jgi:hypothetical protein